MWGLRQALIRAHNFFNTLQRRAGEAWFPIMIGLMMVAVFSAIGIAAGQVQEVLADYIGDIHRPFASFNWGRASVTLGAIFVLSSALRFWTARLLGANIMSYSAIAGLDRLERMFLSIAFLLPWLGLGFSFLSAHVAYANLVSHTPGVVLHGPLTLFSMFGIFIFNPLLSPFPLWALLCFTLPFLFMLAWWTPFFTNARRQFDTSRLVHLFWALILPVSFAVLAAAFYFMPDWVLQEARDAGPIPVVALSLAGITAAGSYLIHLGRKIAFPIFVFVALVPLTVGAFGLDDNHQLRRLGEHYSEQRPTLRNAARAFAESPEQPGAPIVLVSTEGGGIRAAFFTASALARIADKCPPMARQIFAISGVSGGAVGAGAFRASVMAQPIVGDHCDLDAVPSDIGWRQAVLEEMFAADHLTPSLAKQVFPELVQRFLPASWPDSAEPFLPMTDRQLGLERSLEQAFAAAYESYRREHPTAGLAPLDVNPMELSAYARPDLAPHLLINMTRVDTGGAYIAGTLDVCAATTGANQIDDFRDLWRTRAQIVTAGPEDRCPDIVTPDFRLSTLVATSARFPLISPAGSVRVDRADGSNDVVRFVDGGYFDNSGIETIMSVESLVAKNLDDSELRNRRILLLHIDSNPDTVVTTPLWRLDFDIHELQAVLAAREQRVLISARRRGGDVELESLSCQPPALVEMKTSSAAALRLGWILSTAAANELRQQVARELTLMAQDIGFAPTMCPAPPYTPPQARLLIAPRPPPASADIP